MLRSLVSVVQKTGKSMLLQNVKSVTAVPGRFSSHVVETDEEFDARYVAYFSRPDIDGWEIRRAINDLAGDDIVPDPTIINAALKACRRVNDYALTIRILETVKLKCGNQVNTIYPYILQEVQPTLTELGIETPEALGYDKPELGLVDVDEIH